MMRRFVLLGVLLAVLVLAFVAARIAESISRPLRQVTEATQAVIESGDLSRRVGVEALEERTLLATLPAPLVSNQTQLPTSFANPQANHPLIDAQVIIDPLDPTRMVAAASYDPTNPTSFCPIRTEFGNAGE